MLLRVPYKPEGMQEPEVIQGKQICYDGKLSFEEFKMYFSDGILSSEELRELFYTIDRRHTKMDMKKPEALSVQRTGRRCGRRTQKNVCLSPTDPYSGMLTSGICVEPDNHWASQISRLQQLIDKLECKNILVVQRQMPVMEEMLEEFRQALKCYTDNTASQSCSLHVSVQKLPEESCFIMYEFWQDRNSWTSYLQSNASKMFQRSVIDFLESPELVTTMLLPVYRMSEIQLLGVFSEADPEVEK
ncbi:N-terminal EF-hand calcium-binding protein 1 [Acipenser ruthenus]|uniref:N-terminal EF-hand calcium-binding protein 1 n=1 Tax=Acipenser ruthenus TaxID=7906 RepID=A0A444V017_ACIRT|nr:N-terminal EF-hand calcium-binding protein 1 [Acipenser ruthenus]